MAFSLRVFFGLVLAALLTGCAATGPVGWDAESAILARIHAPEFPARDFLITDYGAKADGSTDCTDAIRRAIEACHAAGGGRVIVPQGVFLTGAVHLLSNVNLHLDDGATLKFSADPAKYLPVVLTRFESIECLNYSPFIYAYGQHDIALTGAGTLDGSAGPGVWWNWLRGPDGQSLPAAPQKADSTLLGNLVAQGQPPEQRIFGAGHFLRPNFIQPYRCENVLIEGVTIRNSPMWEINPVLCSNVIVRGVNIQCPGGPNNDGCDPECSRDVLIEDCTFNTGDDCIAIKSGRNDDGRRVGVAAENIIIRRCAMQDGHGGVVIGSEVSGGVRNVFAEDCRMDSPHLERVLRVKSNAVRGGTMENIFLRNIAVGQVAEAVVTVDFRYEEGANGPWRPVLRNVVLDHVACQSSPRVLYVLGFPAATIDGLHFENCDFRGLNSPEVVVDAGAITFQNTRLEPKQIPPSLSTRPNPNAP
ncbi:MAG TPA: glycoside hydrolase family 28 protein [Opitutales bacterium]|nr:glycoside hydrolase family 28 protein [Opitutales bacterium]